MILTRARALVELRQFANALRILGQMGRGARTEEEINDILELRFTCYLSNHGSAAAKCSDLLPLLINRTLTPKLHILAAQVYILIDSKHSPDHPAIPHLFEVLKLYPTAVELAEKLLLIGSSIDTILSHLPSGAAKMFIQSLQLSSRSEFSKAVSILSDLSKTISPTPTCILNHICINAISAKNWSVFDATASLIPLDDLEIVDLRAARLKSLRKLDDLNILTLTALNCDEENANSWLAFSHLLELSNDHQRALQTTRKALLLDRHSRRGFMRHGELRMQRNDTRKALTAFTKAHHLQEGIDSYTAIVQCCCALNSWADAEAYATRAVALFPAEGEQGAAALYLLGLAIRHRDAGRSVKLFRKALKLEPLCVEPLSMLIEMKMNENEFEEAEKVLREFRGGEEDLFFWLRLGEIYAVKKEFGRALEYASRAARIEPGNERAREMLERLESMIRDNDSEFEVEEEMTE
jgi:tetratricopeptide (TPR) repeat protein